MKAVPLLNRSEGSCQVYEEKNMKNILFVCHGNICRSPMAEFVMKKLVREMGLEDSFSIASAATSTEEIGNPVYPPVKRLLEAEGMDCSKKRARQIKKTDYRDYDLLIGMDEANLRNMRRFFGGDPENKIRLLLSYTERPGEVADPWYTGNFSATWTDVWEGCRGLLKAILS